MKDKGNTLPVKSFSRNSKKHLLILLLLCGWHMTSPFVSAQNLDLQGINSIGSNLITFNENTDITLTDPDKRVLLANSVENYPVTPGDIYQIVYIGANRINTLEGMVGGDLTLNLNIFGTIKVNGLTYNQLREKVIQLVLQGYPQSKAQLSLRSTGIFQIYLKGEVNASGFINCWGMSRLSEAIQGRLTAWSSLRQVEVISPAGLSRTYDLFAAARFGKQEQDPYVQPGITIVLHKFERQIKISGEVHQPGTYQLLNTEGVTEVIQSYANGFTALANTRQLEIRRPQPDQKTTPVSAAGNTNGHMYYLDGTDPASASFALQDGDEIFVPSNKEKLPIVYFEGALDANPPAQGQGQNSLNDTTEKIVYTFNWGEKLASAMRNLQSHLATTANLSAAYLLREGETASVPVNLVELLHNYSPEKDVELHPYDRIIIPFKQYWVTVSGAVAKPGLYAYQPERNYRYYLDLAGGAIPEKNIANAVSITDRQSSQQPSSRLIQPEDTIYVHYNHPLYYVGQWATLISAAIAVTSLVISLMNLSKP